MGKHRTHKDTLAGKERTLNRRAIRAVKYATTQIGL